MHFNALLISQCVPELIICAAAREYAKCDKWCCLQMAYLLVPSALLCYAEVQCAE